MRPAVSGRTSTVASSANSAYDQSGTSYPTTWQPDFHWGLLALPDVVTSHNDNGTPISPWYCNGHEVNMAVWTK